MDQFRPESVGWPIVDLDLCSADAPGHGLRGRAYEGKSDTPLNGLGLGSVGLGRGGLVVVALSHENLGYPDTESTLLRCSNSASLASSEEQMVLVL